MAEKSKREATSGDGLTPRPPADTATSYTRCEGVTATPPVTVPKGAANGKLRREDPDTGKLALL